MSLSVRSKLFSLLTTPKSYVIPKRQVSCISYFSCRYNDKSLVIGGPHELVKTDEHTVNVVDVKSIMKKKLYEEPNQEYASFGFSKKSRRIDDDSKMPMSRESILSLLDTGDGDNHLFHTLAGRLNKAGDDCHPKEVKNAGRVKYHCELEDAINKQIMSELNAAFGYLSIASFFGRSDIGKKGTHNFFMVMCNEEIGHAMRLIEYQLSRGGTVKLCNISVNESVEWCSIAKALELALEIEKVITNEICNLACLAKKHDDYHAENLIISEFVTEQYESINKLARMLARAIKIGKCGVADHLIDNELMQDTGHSSKSRQK